MAICFKGWESRNTGHVTLLSIQLCELNTTLYIAYIIFIMILYIHNGFEPDLEQSAGGWKKYNQINGAYTVTDIPPYISRIVTVTVKY